MSTVTKENVLFNELCRVCLHKSNNMRHLMNTSDETTKTLVTQLSAIINKELQFSEIYPCYLCADCESKLRISVDFWTLCMESDRRITSIVKQTKRIQSQFVVEVAIDDKNRESKDCEKPIQSQAVFKLQPKNKNCHLTNSLKIEEQPLKIIDPIDIKLEDTDDVAYEDTDDDPFEKLEVEEEDIEDGIQSRILIDHTYSSKSRKRKRMQRAARQETLYPWEIKLANKSVRTQQLPKGVSKSSKLRLVRYPKEEVQAVIDAVEQNGAHEVACLFCSSMCQGRNALSHHVGIAHRDKKNNWCCTCNELVEDMASHRKGGHNDLLKCPYCNKRLPNIGKFKAHLQTHMMIDKEYRCVKCDVLYQSERNLMIHLRRFHSSDALYACDSCPQKYKSEVQLQLHQKIHYKQDNKECPDCLMKFNTSEEIDRHVCTQQNNAILESFEGKESFCKLCERKVRSMALHYKQHHDPNNKKENNKKEKKKKSGQGPSLCALCGRSYRTTFSLNVHMRRHAGEKPFECSFCGMSLSTKNTLKEHERTHTGERPYICSYCGKSFRVRTALHFHLPIHTGKPIQCPICPKKYARRIELRVHMNMHTGKRPYQCEVCGQGFVMHCHLAQHRLKHTGERPHQCEFCDKAYPHHNSLKKHVKIVHLGEKFLKCPFCSYECNQWIYLKRHKEEHHMGEVKEVDSS